MESFLQKRNDDYKCLWPVCGLEPAEKEAALAIGIEVVPDFMSGIEDSPSEAHSDDQYMSANGGHDAGARFFDQCMIPMHHSRREEEY